MGDNSTADADVRSSNPLASRLVIKFVNNSLTFYNDIISMFFRIIVSISNLQFLKQYF